MSKDIVKSTKARLLNLHKKTNIPFNRLLLYYFNERLLFRLSKSKHKKLLILKGGSLLLSLNIEKGRPTRDIDFLAQSFSPNKDTLKKIIADIIKIKSEDGVTFDLDSYTAEEITVEKDYKGLRIKLLAFLGNAREKIQLDIGVGDEVVPAPLNLDYPTLLNDETFNIIAYSLETVIAEKLETMISLSYLNSRMKDFYDIALISNSRNFSGKILQEAIQATFQKRGIILNDNIEIFSSDFKNDKTKQVQWSAFLRKSDIKETSNKFIDIVQTIENFILLILQAILRKETLNRTWDSDNNEWTE